MAADTASLSSAPPDRYELSTPVHPWSERHPSPLRDPVCERGPGPPERRCASMMQMCGNDRPGRAEPTACHGVGPSRRGSTPFFGLPDGRSCRPYPPPGVAPCEWHGPRSDSRPFLSPSVRRAWRPQGRRSGRRSSRRCRADGAPGSHRSAIASTCGGGRRAADHHPVQTGSLDGSRPG